MGKSRGCHESCLWAASGRSGRWCCRGCWFSLIPPAGVKTPPRYRHVETAMPITVVHAFVLLQVRDVAREGDRGKGVAGREDERARQRQDRLA